MELDNSDKQRENSSALKVVEGVEQPSSAQRTGPK